MREDRAKLIIDLKGDIFQAINDQFHMERECCMAGEPMPYSKMGDIYAEIFQCNKVIRMLNRECFGSIAFNDNHIVVEWDIDGCMVEFYFEQYWEIIELTIDLNNSRNALVEIVKAFQLYFNKIFSYEIIEENNSRINMDGIKNEYKAYRLVIEDGLG